MRRGARVVLLAVVLVAATAAATHDDAAAAARRPSPRVVLVDAGSPPRAALRLRLAAGHVDVRDVEVRQTVEQRIDGTPEPALSPPPIRMRTASTVDAVGADGIADLTLAYTDVVVLDDGSVSPAERAQLEADLAPLTSVTGTQTVTERNRVLDTALDGTEGFDVLVAQSLRQLADQTGSLAVPFPAEKVGAGARWRAVTEARVNGIDLRQTHEFVLRARDGDTVEVGVSYVQTAPRQRVEMAGLPAGTVVTVRRYRLTGAGDATIDLTQSAPVASMLRATGTQVLAFSGDEAGVLEQQVTYETRIGVPQ